MSKLSPKYELMKQLNAFFRMEAAGGLVLVIAAIFGLIVANSPLTGIYHYFFNEIHIFNQSILLWINDGLMAVFFFHVGLQIKYEFVKGRLSSRDRAILPALAAVGGMIMPALIFVGFNLNMPQNLSGWAIPSATDIAFTLGVLSLLGSKAPMSLKILLTAIAVIDDLLAIVVIALFYGHGFNPIAIAFVVAILLILWAFNRLNITSKWVYAVLGVLLWLAVFYSGIHATLAGVATAFFVPLQSRNNPDKKPAQEMQQSLGVFVAFFVMPLFAFANAGVSFLGIKSDALFHPITLGIFFGLFAGKQLGIFSTLYVAIKSGLCPKPLGVNWRQLYGGAVLCGIGFTMSLFIGGLAYAGLEEQVYIRLGVLGGSVLSAILGYILIKKARP